MARRPGGYQKSDDIEWAECHRSLYGEAIAAASRMGQNVYTWMNDAIAHHVYLCDRLQAQERYQADIAEATRTCGITPMPYEDKYQVNRAKPTITRKPGQGSGAPGGHYRP